MRVCDPQVLFCCLIYYLYKVEGNHVTGLISLFLDTGTECSVVYIKTAVLDFLWSAGDFVDLSYVRL
jgi:hypothetical protein